MLVCNSQICTADAPAPSVRLHPQLLSKMLQNFQNYTQILRNSKIDLKIQILTE